MIWVLPSKTETTGKSILASGNKMDTQVALDKFFPYNDYNILE